VVILYIILVGLFRRYRFYYSSYWYKGMDSILESSQSSSN